MKTNRFKALIKEAVKEAIQEELKEILLEAIKSPKHVISERQISQPQPQNFEHGQSQVNQTKPEISLEQKRQMYQEMIMETQTPQNEEFQVPANFNSSEGELPGGDLSFDMISNLTGLKLK